MLNLPLWLIGILTAIYGLGCTFLWIAEDVYEKMLPESERGTNWFVIPVMVLWPITIPIFMTVILGDRLGRWAAKQ